MLLEHSFEHGAAIWNLARYLSSKAVPHHCSIRILPTSTLSVPSPAHPCPHAAFPLERPVLHHPLPHLRPPAAPPPDTTCSRRKGRCQASLR